MVFDLIFCLFLLLLPAILWIVPKTRYYNGSWIIALKTFPVGMIAGILTDDLLILLIRLISEWRNENIAFPNWLMFSMPLLAAFLTMILLGLLIDRKFGTEKRYNPLPSILLFILLLPIVLLTYTLSSLAFNIFEYRIKRENYHFEWQSIYLPQEGNTRIVFEQQSIHPFLAEYNYRLRFTCEGKTFYHRLFTNCGGRTNFNLYRLKNGAFLFRDKDWDYLVDISKQKVFRLEMLDGKLYAAEVPNEELNSWGGPEQRNGKIIMHMGKHQVPAEDVTGILDGMKYYGTIRRKFHSAAEKPEQKITKTAERMEIHRKQREAKVQQ